MKKPAGFIPSWPRLLREPEEEGEAGAYAIGLVVDAGDEIYSPELWKKPTPKPKPKPRPRPRPR